MVIGAWIRHYFNLRHAGRTLWWIPLTAAAGIAAIAVWIRPSSAPGSISPAGVSFAQVQPILAQRCAFCHSLHPRSSQYTAAPQGIRFDTPGEIKAQIDQIKAVAVDSTVMPLGNVTHMTPQERTLLGQWIAAGARIK
jgi:uncharacterized membrane protein